MKRTSIIIVAAISAIMLSGCETTSEPKVVIKVVERTGFEIPKSLQTCPITKAGPWANDQEFAVYALKAIGDGPNCQRNLLAVVDLWKKWKAGK